MFVGALVLGAACAVGAIALTGSLLAGIVVMMVLWVFLPILGYKILSKRQMAANRPGPYILLEDGFLTIPRRGGSDMGLDLKDVVLCTFVLQVWERVHTQADGKVIKSKLRQQFAVLQLEQPEKIVRFLAELGPNDKVPDLSRLHRSPSRPEGWHLESIDIWPDDFNDFLTALRSTRIHESEAKI